MTSRDPHFTRDDAEAYVLGALEPARSSALEAHAAECEPCSRLLQAEALLEEDLRQVAQQGLPTGLPGKLLRLPAARLARRALRPVAALAAAAALAFLAVRHEAPAPLPESAPVVTQLPQVAPQGLPGINAGPLDLDGATAADTGRVVACPDLATRASCLASANAQGLMVQYPEAAGDVPRYEARVAVPQGALTSLRPFPL
jgi:hypothetical protein